MVRRSAVRRFVVWGTIMWGLVVVGLIMVRVITVWLLVEESEGVKILVVVNSGLEPALSIKVRLISLLADFITSLGGKIECLVKNVLRLLRDAVVSVGNVFGDMFEGVPKLTQQFTFGRQTIEQRLSVVLNGDICNDLLVWNDKSSAEGSKLQKE